jgi:hypothetical protein
LLQERRLAVVRAGDDAPAGLCKSLPAVNSGNDRRNFVDPAKQAAKPALIPGLMQLPGNVCLPKN